MWFLNWDERLRRLFINDDAVARACEAASRPRSTREGVGSLERSGRPPTRLGGGVRLLCGCGRGDSKGQPRGRSTATEAPQRVSEANERGAHRAARVLAAGALEVFTVDLRSVIYKRAAEDLDVLSVDSQLAIWPVRVLNKRHVRLNPTVPVRGLFDLIPLRIHPSLVVSLK